MDGIEVLDVDPAERLHEFRHAGGHLRCGQQVHVIGHEYIGMKCDAVLAQAACEAGPKEDRVGARDEDRLAIVTALDDVERQLGDEEARQARHTPQHMAGRRPRYHPKVESDPTFAMHNDSDETSAQSSPGNALWRWVATLGACMVLFVNLAHADTASGTISYQSKVGPILVNVKNVYFVKGPDAVSGKTIRHLIFSSADLSAKIKGCVKISCTDSDLNEGMTVDLDAGPRLNYWVVGSGQRVQYSGTAKPETLKLATDTPQRIAGKLTIDDSGAGGAKASVDFDATLLKEFAK